MTLTELPLQTPGRLFRSPMPFSEFDRGGLLLDLFKLNEISVVVVLAEEEECLAIAGCDLVEVYRHDLHSADPKTVSREFPGLRAEGAAGHGEEGKHSLLQVGELGVKDLDRPGVVEQDVALGVTEQPQDLLRGGAFAATLLGIEAGARRPGPAAWPCVTRAR